MNIALIDNGSLAPAAHEALRAAAAEITEAAGVGVTPVSWKHSDRVRFPGGGKAWTLKPWIRAGCAAGQSEFVFIPYFISPGGAIAAAVRRDLDALRAAELNFSYRFADGLTPSVLAEILADQIGGCIAENRLARPAVIVVDHGGPSRISADVRDRTAELLAVRIAGSASVVLAASMESPDGDAYAFNQPLLADALAGLPPEEPAVIAPLFLAPGRHAGPTGDLAQIAARAAPGPVHFARLIGGHPLVAAALAAALSRISSVTTA